MRPYSVIRMFEFLVVAVIEEMVGDSFNPHFTESMTLRSFLSVCMTLRSLPSENLTLRSFPSENMTFFANAGPTDRRTDRPTDRRTDGPTDMLKIDVTHVKSV